jgi:hypothetical protein
LEHHTWDGSRTKLASLIPGHSLGLMCLLTTSFEHWFAQPNHSSYRSGPSASSSSDGGGVNSDGSSNANTPYVTNSERHGTGGSTGTSHLLEVSAGTDCELVRIPQRCFSQLVGKTRTRASAKNVVYHTTPHHVTPFDTTRYHTMPHHVTSHHHTTPHQVSTNPSSCT